MVWAMGEGLVVWLTELADPDDYFHATARFSGHLDDGSEVGEELADEPLADALGWARERAEVVVVQMRDSPQYFSAGARHIDATMPVWDDSIEVAARHLRELTLRVPSGAMAPTLQIGEHLSVSADVTYAPQIGDVVVFHPPAGADPASATCGNPEQGAGHLAACASPVPQKSFQTFIKRIVAGPGDTLAIVEGRVIRNGERVDEPYARTARLRDPSSEAAFELGPDCNFPTPITIPPDHYFVLGDNRPESDDSRFWGPVPRPWIIGKVYPPGRPRTRLPPPLLS